MTVGAFVKHLQFKDVDISLRHGKNIIWSGECKHLPGRYRHYKIDMFFWDEFQWCYDVSFLRENDIQVKEID